MANPPPSEATQFTVNHQPSTSGRRKSPYSQALQWQDVLNKARDTDPKLLVPLSQGARAWRDVEAMKREIKMQPKPRPIDVSDRAVKKRQAIMTQFLGPLEEAGA